MSEALRRERELYCCRFRTRGSASYNMLKSLAFYPFIKDKIGDREVKIRGTKVKANFIASG